VIELKGTSHYSFTDVELFLGPVGRIAWSALAGSTRDPDEVHRTTVRLVRDQFFTMARLSGASPRALDPNSSLR